MSKPHNTNLCKNAAPNLSSDVRNNDKQHGDLHTSNTSLNNNPNNEAPSPQRKSTTIPVRITNRGHVTPNRTEPFQSRKKYVRSYAHNNNYGPLSSTNLNESNLDFVRTVPVRKPKYPCLPRKISRKQNPILPVSLLDIPVQNSGNHANKHNLIQIPIQTNINSNSRPSFTRPKLTSPINSRLPT